jgi:spermidine/putrescine transport system substrate-binding protein
MTQDQDPFQDGQAVAITRRRLLQVSAAAGISAFLAACGTAGTRTTGPSAIAAAPSGTPAVTGTPGAGTPGASTPGASGTAGATAEGETPAATETGQPSGPPGTPATGSFKMATWIGYIDVGKKNKKSHPSLERFAQETGVEVDYQEAVNGNEEFFASQLKGPLQSGLDAGWDIVVLTDWMIVRLIKLGWLEAITPGANFPTNLLDVYKARDWDPGNKYAAPWQSGMTGIAYDRKKTGPLSSLDVFFDPKWAGKMNYLSEMRDTVGLVSLKLGNDPTTLAQQQFDAAIAAIKQSVSDQLVRAFTGNSYVEDMQRGDISLAMGWSGDVLGLLVPDQTKDQDFQWQLPDQGGMLWTDNMAIPKGAKNKAQAEVFINWYYIAKNAAQVEAYVNYVCPVVGADVEIGKIDASLATNVLIFPTTDMQGKLHQFVGLDLNAASQWESAFSQAIGQ